MSVTSIQTAILGLQREIEGIQRKLASEASSEATKTSKINSERQALSRASASAAAAKLRAIEGLQRDLAGIQRRRADLSKTLATKTARLHAEQQKLMKEQATDMKKLTDQIKRDQASLKATQASVLARLTRPAVKESAESASAQYDAFISHASEDKEEIVRPLAGLLEAAGLAVWYDETQLRVGDSLRRSIDKGLANSRFGIVVLSPSFFAKNWPQYELDGLVSKEIEGSKVILPLWHRVTKSDVLQRSPSLADKLALSTASLTLNEIVAQLGEVLLPRK